MQQSRFAGVDVSRALRSHPADRSSSPRLVYILDTYAAVGAATCLAYLTISASSALASRGDEDSRSRGKRLTDSVTNTLETDARRISLRAVVAPADRRQPLLIRRVSSVCLDLRLKVLYFPLLSSRLRVLSAKERAQYEPDTDRGRAS